ncbi:MAG: TIGR02391 family protein, partial [Candidatus Helarchaeota archaeon]
MANTINDNNLNDSFWTDIHKEIINVSKNLFKDNHYAEAVFSAFKKVNNTVKEIVKKKTGKELDGTSLMLRAFKDNDPIIKLTDCENKTEKDIQKGYQFLFAGSILGIRNPKAHDFIEIDRKRAIHFIYLASL